MTVVITAVMSLVLTTMAASEMTTVVAAVGGLQQASSALPAKSLETGPGRRENIAARFQSVGRAGFPRLVLVGLFPMHDTREHDADLVQGPYGQGKQSLRNHVRRRDEHGDEDHADDHVPAHPGQ